MRDQGHHTYAWQVEMKVGLVYMRAPVHLQAMCRI